LVELEEDPVEEDEDDDEVQIDIGFTFLGERKGERGEVRSIDLGNGY
jgi:hypothetical protein